MTETTPEREWVWYGHAGHLVVASRCNYHLCTKIGKYLISTIGDYHPVPDGPMKTIGAGKEAYFETLVFLCTGEDNDGEPVVDHWSEIDGIRYATSLAAGRGHLEKCRKYAVGEPS